MMLKTIRRTDWLETYRCDREQCYDGVLDERAARKERIDLFTVVDWRDMTARDAHKDAAQKDHGRGLEVVH